MKKYILLAAACSVLTGCYDLDQFPHDQLNSATFWKTETHAHQGMMSIYNAMKDEDVFGCYYGIDGYAEIACNSLDNYVVVYGTYTDRSASVQDKWRDTYEGIARTNTLLQNIDNVEMSDEKKAEYKGEAKFMRAMYYFHLLDFYGGVPLYDENTVVSDEYMTMQKPRSSVEDVRQFILNDLKDAIDVLPVKWEQSEYGRATRGAAVALRGKVKLYAGDYSGAAADFEEIVNDPEGRGYGYELYPDYKNLFTPEGDSSSEMIFAIQNMGGIGTEYGMPFGLRLGSRSSFQGGWNNIIATDILADMYEKKDGQKFNWDDYIPGFTTSQDIQRETFWAELSNGVVTKYPEKKDLIRQCYEDRDPRLEYTLITPYSHYYGCNGTVPRDIEFVIGSGTSETNGYIRDNMGWYSYLFRKFVPEGDMNGTLTSREHVPINFPLIRYADVLLMLAECYNELDRQDDAIELINEIRQRPTVNMPALNSGPAWLEAHSKDEVFERIVHERAVELANEGHRFGDLKRWHMCVEKLNFVYDDIAGMERYTRVFTDRDYLWPIPAVEFERNPNLGDQNPGW